MLFHVSKYWKTFFQLEREKSSNRLIHDLKARAETLEKDLEITSGQQVKKKKPVQKIASKPKAGGKIYLL